MYNKYIKTGITKMYKYIILVLTYGPVFFLYVQNYLHVF